MSYYFGHRQYKPGASDGGHIRGERKDVERGMMYFNGRLWAISRWKYMKRTREILKKSHKKSFWNSMNRLINWTTVVNIVSFMIMTGLRRWGNDWKYICTQFEKDSDITEALKPDVQRCRKWSVHRSPMNEGRNAEVVITPRNLSRYMYRFKHGTS